MSYDTARERLEALPPGPLLGGEASRHVDVHGRRFAAHAPTDLALALAELEAARPILSAYLTVGERSRPSGFAKWLAARDAFEAAP